MDQIILTQLAVNTIIGMQDWERQRQQKILIDLALSIDLAKAGNSDNLNDSVDYAKVADVCTHIAASNKFYLIESLAEKIANVLLNTFKFKYIKIKVTKPEILPNCRSVSIILKRGL